MDIGTGVELECSYGAGDGRTRSRVAFMPKERSGRPRLDRSCDWEKYGYDSEQSLHWHDSSLTRWNVDMLCLTFSNHFSDVFSTFFIQKPQSTREWIHYSATLHKLFGPFNNFPEFVRIGTEFHCRTT